MQSASAHAGGRDACAPSVCLLSKTLPQPSSSQLQEEIIATQAQLVFNVLGPGTRDGPLVLLSNEILCHIQRQKPFTRLYALRGFRSHSQHRPVKRQNINNARHTTGHSSHVTAHRPRAVRSPLSVWLLRVPTPSAGRAARTFMENNKSCGAAVCCGAKIHAHEDASTLRALLSIQS